MENEHLEMNQVYLHKQHVHVDILGHFTQNGINTIVNVSVRTTFDLDLLWRIPET